MKLNALCDWYANLSPQSLEYVPELYHENARFQDPFNDVQGHDAILGIFRHMFENTDDPKFRILESQSNEPVAWVAWTFSVGVFGKVVDIDGMTRLEFADDGRVLYHRDYWDASQLYEQIPIAGRIIGFLRKKMSPAENHQK